MPAARWGLLVAFGLVGLTLLIAGPTVSIASEWGAPATITIGAAGAVALLIAAVMYRNM